jgi:N-acetylglutamate synthase-like GNAT family acetyltransferase
MNKKLNIRKMRAGEEITVSRLCKRCIREINSKDRTKKQVGYLCNYFSVKNLKDSLKETVIYVALLADKIVATGSLCEGRIKAFFVNPNYHKQGIGAKLAKHMEKKLKEKGYSSVFLRSSKYAVGFYKKLGFKEAEKIDSPEVGEVTVMKKKIK